MTNIFLEIKKYILQNELSVKKIKWIIIYSTVIYAFNQSALWLYQPYFKLSGVSVMYFGLVFATFQIVSAITSKYAHKLEKKLGEKHSFIMLIFLVAVSFLLMGHFIFLFSFSFCFIQQFVRGYKNIIVTDYINRLVEPHLRATILSVESFVGKFLYATIAPIIGWIVDVYSLTQALMMIGVVTLIFGAVFLFSLKTTKVF